MTAGKYKFAMAELQAKEAPEERGSVSLKVLLAMETEEKENKPQVGTTLQLIHVHNRKTHL